MKLIQERCFKLQSLLATSSPSIFVYRDERQIQKRSTPYVHVNNEVHWAHPSFSLVVKISSKNSLGSFIIVSFYSKKFIFIRNYFSVQTVSHFKHMNDYDLKLRLQELGYSSHLLIFQLVMTIQLILLDLDKQNA